MLTYKTYPEQTVPVPKPPLARLSPATSWLASRDDLHGGVTSVGIELRD